MGKLAEKVALITGGESGIGLATARLFVAEGARVHIIGLDAVKVHQATAALGDDVAQGTVADVADEVGVREAIGHGIRSFGKYDIIVSNAGVSGVVAAISDYPSAVFARTLAVNVLGAFHILKHAAPHVGDGGSIIIMSSLVGLVGFEDISGYVAAKHGQVGLMRTATKELAKRRIRVNSLHPGPTSTSFQDSLEMRMTGRDQVAAAKIFDGMIPLGRHMTSEEVARAALYLASDDSAMVTGSTFRIDGGLGG